MTKRSGPLPGTALCALDEIDEPGAKGLALGEGTSRLDIFLIRKDDAVYAYLNRCPHAATRLDNWPDRFLTQDETQILCGNHAALFRIEDGFCTSGPCAGKSLKAVPVEVSGGMVRVAV
ncbi:MAG: Rieske (2Fe-2S) protein [Parvibaculum sp.]|uniref:Rieske (2Fe-2S) protein n=1 Tax=Parvibaculum sp. TaxID=2024848 RepID=UPI002ABA9E0B|nr:Rieske (2Fe-2S) protein [Parvibaculum sp.]MDZ4381149.1 Rieske (2Fe-2S) protein [Parvibaculum sp.]